MHGILWLDRVWYRINSPRFRREFQKSFLGYLHKTVCIREINTWKLHKDDNREYVIANRKYFIPRFYGSRVVQLRRTIKSYIADNDIARGAEGNSLSSRMLSKTSVHILLYITSHPNVITRSEPRKMRLYHPSEKSHL